MDADWTLVIALTDTFGARILLRDPRDAEGFVRWMRANGWTVRTEPTKARSSSALGRTRDEEDLAGSLAVAYSRWARVALGQ